MALLGNFNNPYAVSRLGLLGDTLTGLGVGLLSQGPSNMPISPFASLGGGLQYARGLQDQRRQLAQQQFSQDIATQQLQRQNDMLDLEKQKAQREQTKYDQQQAAIQQMAKDHPELGPMFQAGGQGAVDAYVKSLYPNPTDDQRNYQVYSQQTQAAGGQPLAFNDWMIQQKRAGANQFTLNQPPQETAYQQALGKSEGDEINSISAGANTSRATIDQLTTINALRSALKQTGNDVSALAPIKMQIGQIAQAVGMQPSDMPTWANGDAAGLYQALDAVTKRLALSNVGSGKEGALPANNFSEADRKFVVGMVANISDTPEGFQAKNLIQQRVAQRNIDKEQLWNSGAYNQASEADYRRFKSDWSKYVNSHPLFTPQEVQNFSQLVMTGNAAAPGPMPKAAPVTTAPQLPGGFQ